MNYRQLSLAHVAVLTVIMMTLSYAAGTHIRTVAEPILFAQPSDGTRDVIKDKLPGIIRKLQSASPHKGKSTFSSEPALSDGDAVVTSKTVTITEIPAPAKATAVKPANKPAASVAVKASKASKRAAPKRTKKRTTKRTKKAARDPIVVFLDDMFSGYKPNNDFWKNL